MILNAGCFTDCVKFALWLNQQGHRFASINELVQEMVTLRQEDEKATARLLEYLATTSQVSTHVR